MCYKMQTQSQWWDWLEIPPPPHFFFLMKISSFLSTWKDLWKNDEDVICCNADEMTAISTTQGFVSSQELRKCSQHVITSLEGSH